MLGLHPSSLSKISTCVGQNESWCWASLGCNAPGAWHVPGWVLAWQTPRDIRDERPGSEMEMRIIIIRTHNALLKSISRWSLYSMLISLPPCDVGGALWCDSLWTSWHGSRDASHSAWHRLGPRSSLEAQVTKIILVPEMCTGKMLTQPGVLKSDFTAFLFLPWVMRWRERRKAMHQRNHESCSQLPTSSSWQNICHMISQPTSFLNPKTTYYSSTIIWQRTLNFSCLILILSQRWEGPCPLIV